MISDKMGSTIYVKKNLLSLKFIFLLSTFHSGQNILVCICPCGYRRNEYHVDYLIPSLPLNFMVIGIINQHIRYQDKKR